MNVHVHQRSGILSSISSSSSTMLWFVVLICLLLLLSECNGESPTLSLSPSPTEEMITESPTPTTALLISCEEAMRENAKKYNMTYAMDLYVVCVGPHGIGFGTEFFTTSSSDDGSTNSAAGEGGNIGLLFWVLCIILGVCIFV